MAAAGPLDLSEFADRRDPGLPVVKAAITIELYLEMDVARGEIVKTDLIRNEYHVG